MTKTHRTLLFLTIVYTAALLMVLAVFGYTPGPDSEGYLMIARRCLNEGEPYPCTALIKGFPFLWNIGAINLVELSLWLTGSIMPLLVVFCVLKALTALLTALIAERLIGSRTAVATMLLYVLYPNNWGQSTMLLSELPMVFFSMAAVYVATGKPTTPRLAAAGVLLCIANWFRPIAILILIAVAIHFFVFFRRDAIRRILLMAAGYAVTICIIGTETWSRTGHFIYQCDSFWYNMADDAYDGATPDAHFGEPLFKKGTPRYIEDMESKTCFECSDIWRERCMAWLMTHKVEYLKKVPWRLRDMLWNDNDNASAFIAKSEKAISGSSKFYVPYRHALSQWGKLSFAQHIALATTAAYYVLVLLAIAGTVVLVRRRRWKAVFLPTAIIIIVTFATVLLVQGETRFKAPFMPYVFMLAGLSVAEIFHAASRKFMPKDKATKNDEQ